MKKKILLFAVFIILFGSIKEVYAYDYTKSCTKEAAIELAKIIFWENGSSYVDDEKNAFLVQISTAAVAINNANRTIKSTEASSDNWQKKIYGVIDNCLSGHSNYRDSTIDELITSKSKQSRFLYMAELVLTGKYTFPTNMTIQAAPYIGEVYATTKEGWHKFKNTGRDDVMIAYEQGLEDTKKDQFGNKLNDVSFEYYSKLAESYMLSDYSAYTVDTVCTGLSNKISSTTTTTTTDKTSSKKTSGVVDACTNPDILRVIYFAKLILDIVKIIIPIGLIIMGMIDFSKSVVISDDGVQKKNMQLFIKRIIYAVLVFAVPWIVETLIVTLGNLTEGVNFTDCLENADSDCIEQIESGTFTGKCYDKKDYACYVCYSDNNYMWAPVKPTTACSGGAGWSNKLEGVSESDCHKGSCYYCSVTNKYVWSNGTPSESCPGGIKWTKDNSKTIKNCK